MNKNETKKLNLARKYRPITFDDVIGQETIVSILKNIISENKVSNTPFIFAGPRGIGKTTMARIYAKAINCKDPMDFQPCGKCENCISIAEGSATDIHEIDGASNNGVNEIRDLKEQLKYMPSMLKYKVYIIDEAHQVTPAAFNALLKILEEPPMHVVFIFASTEIHKFPITVRSRCLMFNFKLISFQNIFNRLKYITTTEKTNIEDPALSLISKAGQGSLRDSISLLEQVSNYKSDNITANDISKLLGFLPQEELKKISTNILLQDTKAALENMNDLLKNGFDENQLMIELQNYFRFLIISKFSKDILKEEGLSDTEMENLSEISKNYSEDRIVRCLQIFSKNYENLRWSSFPKIWLEISIYKSSRDYFPIENIFSDMTTSEQKPKPKEYAIPALPTETKEIKLQNSNYNIQPEPEKNIDDINSIVNDITKGSPVLSGYMHNISQPISFDGNNLKIYFSNSYSKEGFEKKKEYVKEVLYKKYNRNIQINAFLDARQNKADSELLNTLGSISEENEINQNINSAMLGNSIQTADEVIEKDKMVKKIIDDFGGEIIDGL